MIARIAERIGEGGLSYCQHCDPSPCLDCPFRKLRPQTVEGQQVAALIRNSAVWLRNDFSGAVIGLDFVEAHARLTTPFDAALLSSLLGHAEQGFLTGWYRAHPNES